MRLWLTAIAALVLFLAPLAGDGWCTGEGLVAFEDLRTEQQRQDDPDDDANGHAVMQLYRKHYEDPDADDKTPQADAFLTYQAAVSEFMMKLEKHDAIEQEFNQRVRDAAEPPGLYYVSNWGGQDTEMFDGSGRIHATRRKMGNEELGMAGKKIWFPSEETLAEITRITELSKQEGAKVDDEGIDWFMRRKDELETELLKLIAGELGKMKAAAGGEEIYGMGVIYPPEGGMKPLKLDLEFLERFMREKNIEIPRPDAGAAADPGDLSEPVQTVTQSGDVSREFKQVYDQFNQPMTESQRTRAELLNDPFRLRIRPADADPQRRVKTYDPVLSHELQAGGLNLPAVDPVPGE